MEERNNCEFIRKFKKAMLYFQIKVFFLVIFLSVSSVFSVYFLLFFIRIFDYYWNKKARNSRNLGTTPLLYFENWPTYFNNSASSRLHKKIIKSEKQKEHTCNKIKLAQEGQYIPRNDTIHHSYMQQKVVSSKALCDNGK